MLPRTGVFTAKGVNMEKQGVQPDVPVVALPEDVAKGTDAQLNKAVEVVTQDVLVWKKNRTAVVTTPGGGSAPMVPLPKQP